MLNDLIHMTQGELLVTYWKVYLVIVVVAIIFSVYAYKSKKERKPLDLFKKGEK